MLSNAEDLKLMCGGGAEVLHLGDLGDQTMIAWKQLINWTLLFKGSGALWHRDFKGKTAQHNKCMLSMN